MRRIDWVLKPLGVCRLPHPGTSAGGRGRSTPSGSGTSAASLSAPIRSKCMLHTCGRWTLNFLMITLCMTPLRELTHRLSGCDFGGCSACSPCSTRSLHFSVYLLLDQNAKFGALWQDIIKRPYITIGMLALLLLIPLGLTSTAKRAAPPGQALDPSAPAGLRDSDLGRLALLVAGQEGYSRAAALRVRTHAPAGIPPLETPPIAGPRQRRTACKD